MMAEAKKYASQSGGGLCGRKWEAAKQVVESDDVVDELFNQVKEELMESYRAFGFTKASAFPLIFYTNFT